MNNYRHGDLAICQIKQLPEDIKASESKTLLAVGSGGNPHTFDNGVFYPESNDEFIIGYLEAKDTKLFHAEHSPNGGLIEDGIYEVRWQVEYTHEGMKQVID